MDHPDQDPDAKLSALDDAIDAMKQHGNSKKAVRDRNTAGRQAMRMASDFAAACLVGTGFGYLGDQWLDTAPWLLVAGMFLGLGTGTKLLLEAEARDSKREAAKSLNEPRE